MEKISVITPAISTVTVGYCHWKREWKIEVLFKVSLFMMESWEETMLPESSKTCPEGADKALNNLERLFKEQLKTTSHDGR